MKKLLALTLSLLMVFSVMPMVMVSAAGTYTVATGEEFVTAMADTTGATITLTADIVVDSQIQLKSGGKGYSVNTQGFDITYANADPESTLPMFKFTQTWANTITFTNNTEDPVVFTNNSLGTWATSVVNGNTMKFVGSGAYSFPQGVTGDKFAVEIGVSNSSTGTAFDGDITGAGIIVRHKNGILNGDVNVGTFSGEVTNSVTKNVPEMTVNGNITATGAITLKRNTLYTVNGNVVSGGTLTLYGVTIPAGYTVQGKNVCIMNQNNTTGATHIYSDVTATNAFLGKAGTVYGKVTADKIIAVGGTFAGDVTVNSGDIFGGKYVTDPTALAGVTVHADVTNDGTYYVLGAYTPVEIVSTGEKYATLAAAYNAAVEGDTIKLIGTLVHTSTDVLATIKKNDITIDLNGQTVTDFTDIIPNSDGRRFIEVSGTAVSKFTLTSSNGQAKIVLNGSTGSASRQIIRISNGNATEGADVTIENFDLTVPSSGGEANAGHRGFINVNGTAVAENNITIKNVKAVCDYTASTGNIGFSGFELGTKANYTIENCEVKSVWTTFSVAASGSVVKVKDSTFGFQKTSCVGVSSTSEVEFDNCVFEKAKVSGGTGVIRVSGASADVTIKNSDIYSGIEVSKAAKVALENCTQDISVNTVNAFNLTTGGQNVSLKDYTINYSVKQSVNNNYAAFTLTGASGANVVLDLENVTINEAYRLFRATNAYNEISISNLAFAKTSSTATFSANGNANITVADGEGYYVDEALTEEYVDFAWKTTKGQTLYIASGTPAVDLPEYDVTIDGEVVATVEEGSTYTLPALEVGKKYVGYEAGQVITVTGPVAITTETISYEVKVDGEVVATVGHGATFTLPALEAGKYYVGYEGVTEIVVTEALELTTATYKYDITIDGVVVDTVAYGDTFTLPAVAEGKYYVDVTDTTFTVTSALTFTTATYKYDITIDGEVVATVEHGATYTLPQLPVSKYYVGVTEKTFTVTGALTFTTAYKTAVDSLLVYDADANGKTGIIAMWGSGKTATHADRLGLIFSRWGGMTCGGTGVSDVNMFGTFADYADTAIGVRFWAAAASDEVTNNIKVYIGAPKNLSDNYTQETLAGETVTAPGTTWTQYTVMFGEDVTAEDIASMTHIMFTTLEKDVAHYVDDVELLVSTDVDSTYDITIDGTVVDTVEHNSIYTLPTPEAGKYYVETEKTKFVVTSDLTFTTAVYEYEVKVDGEVKATLPYGSTYVLPTLEDGKYYVGYEVGDEIVVTDTVEITTATYTYDIEIDGKVVATVEHGTEYTLPALEAGKYYVDVTETTFVVTEALSFTTATYTYDITIDGVKVQTVAYGETFVLPATIEGKQYVGGYVVGQEFVVTEALAFATEDIPAPEVSVSTKTGAGVRFNEVTGLRFTATLDTEAIAQAKALGYTVTMGTLIAPADRFASYDDLTFDADANNYLDVVTEGYYNDVNGTIAGSIANIREANYGRDFFARAYVKLVKDGKEVVYYAEAANARSIKSVAQAALDDDSVEYNSAQVALLEKWAAANPWA